MNWGIFLEFSPVAHFNSIYNTLPIFKRKKVYKTIKLTIYSLTKLTKLVERDMNRKMHLSGSFSFIRHSIAISNITIFNQPILNKSSNLVHNELGSKGTLYSFMGILFLCFIEPIKLNMAFLRRFHKYSHTSSVSCLHIRQHTSGLRCLHKPGLPLSSISSILVLHKWKWRNYGEEWRNFGGIFGGTC